MEATFEKEFAALRALGPEHFTLQGPTILVEMIPEEELKTKSGLIIATPKAHAGGDSVSAHKLEHGIVLMVGPGHYDENAREYVPLDVKPGQVIVLPQYGKQVISTWPGLYKPLQNKLALVTGDAVFGIYQSPEAFQKAKEAMNA